MTAPAKALLLDVGDVYMEANWVIFDRFEAHIRRTVPGRGPMDPAADPDWLRYLDGDIGIDQYWDAKSAATGFATRLDFWKATVAALGDDVFAPDAVQLVADARAAGRRVGILSNDLIGFFGRPWVDSRPELAGFDAFVDAAEVGERKPAPGPYRRAAADLDLDPGEVVFLDDTPVCVDGARAVGMIGVHVDPLHRGFAFERARQLLGLGDASPEARLVGAAEAAYAARDLAAVRALYHPDVITYWQGARVANGRAELERFHVERLGFGPSGRPDPRVRKRLRVADGDTIAIEWQSPGMTLAELWTMRYGRIIEWAVYGALGEDRP